MPPLIVSLIPIKPDGEIYPKHVKCKKASGNAKQKHNSVSN